MADNDKAGIDGAGQGTNSANATQAPRTLRPLVLTSGETDPRKYWRDVEGQLRQELARAPRSVEDAVEMETRRLSKPLAIYSDMVTAATGQPYDAATHMRQQAELTHRTFLSVPVLLGAPTEQLQFSTIRFGSMGDSSHTISFIDRNAAPVQTRGYLFRHGSLVTNIQERPTGLSRPPQTSAYERTAILIPQEVLLTAQNLGFEDLSHRIVSIYAASSHDSDHARQNSADPRVSTRGPDSTLRQRLNSAFNQGATVDERVARWIGDQPISPNLETMAYANTRDLHTELDRQRIARNGDSTSPIRAENRAAAGLSTTSGAEPSSFLQYAAEDYLRRVGEFEQAVITRGAEIGIQNPQQTAERMADFLGRIGIAPIAYQVDPHVVDPSGRWAQLVDYTRPDAQMTQVPLGPDGESVSLERYTQLHALGVAEALGDTEAHERAWRARKGPDAALPVPSETFMMPEILKPIAPPAPVATTPAPSPVLTDYNGGHSVSIFIDPNHPDVFGQVMKVSGAMQEVISRNLGIEDPHKGGLDLGGDKPGRTLAFASHVSPEEAARIAQEIIEKTGAVSQSTHAESIAPTIDNPPPSPPLDLEPRRMETADVPPVHEASLASGVMQGYGRATSALMVVQEASRAYEAAKEGHYWEATGHGAMATFSTGTEVLNSAPVQSWIAKEGAVAAGKLTVAGAGEFMLRRMPLIAAGMGAWGGYNELKGIIAQGPDINSPNGIEEWKEKLLRTTIAAGIETAGGIAGVGDIAREAYYVHSMGNASSKQAMPGHSATFHLLGDAVQTALEPLGVDLNYVPPVPPPALKPFSPSLTPGCTSPSPSDVPSILSPEEVAQVVGAAQRLEASVRPAAGHQVSDDKHARTEVAEEPAAYTPVALQRIHTKNPPSTTAAHSGDFYFASGHAPRGSGR